VPPNSTATVELPLRFRPKNVQLSGKSVDASSGLTLTPGTWRFVIER
jgi:hypothetical protein